MRSQQYNKQPLRTFFNGLAASENTNFLSKHSVHISAVSSQCSEDVWSSKLSASRARNNFNVCRCTVLNSQFARLISLKADSHIACCYHAATLPFPCRALPLRVQNVSFPFDLHSAAVSDSHLPCHAHAMLRPCHFFEVTAQHGRLSKAVLCCGLEKNGMVGAWHWQGIASVNQTRPRCVNQMGKTHSKYLAAGHGTAGERHGHGMGAAWERHAVCESALILKPALHT